MDGEKSVIFGGAGGEPRQTDKGDYESRIKELEKELHKQKVESGRLRKMSEENARLRKELEDARRSSDVDSAISDLPDDIRDGIADDYLKGSAMVSQNVAKRAMGETAERLSLLENRVAVSEKSNFENEIARTYPGFIRDIGPGGDKCEAWQDYLKYNRASLDLIRSNLDFGGMSRHIRQFYESIGVSAPSGGREYATSDPRSSGGARPADEQGPADKDTYTVKEYQEIMYDAQRKFHGGEISRREYTDTCERLTKAAKEGRVR